MIHNVEDLVQLLVGVVVKRECIRTGPCLYHTKGSPCYCAQEVANDLWEELNTGCKKK